MIYWIEWNFFFFVIQFFSGLICEWCKEEYSSYDEFMKYPIPNATHLKRVLISKTENPTIVAQEVDETAVDFLLPGIFVAITSDTNSIDTVWFIQIAESNFVEDSVM